MFFDEPNMQLLDDFDDSLLTDVTDVSDDFLEFIDHDDDDDSNTSDWFVNVFFV